MQKKFNFDKETTDLIYEGVEDPTKFGDLLYNLQKDKVKATTVKEKLIELKALPEVKQEPNLLKPGAKVDEYKELLDDIFRVVQIRRHPIVLEGFLNGTEYISYFEIDFFGEYGIDKVEDHLDLNAFTKITIEKIEDEAARKKRIREQRVKCNDRRTYHRYDDLSNLSYRLSEIYDDYVELAYDSKKKFKNDHNIKDTIISELNIENYNGFLAMNTSLQEYISEIVNDVRKLRGLSEH